MATVSVVQADTRYTVSDLTQGEIDTIRFALHAVNNNVAGVGLFSDSEKSHARRLYDIIADVS